jgi:hypothetical protein
MLLSNKIIKYANWLSLKKYAITSINDYNVLIYTVKTVIDGSTRLIFNLFFEKKFLVKNTTSFRFLRKKGDPSIKGTLQIEEPVNYSFYGIPNTD